ncbi:MAG: outer membrane lipoprotein carrier protein LolA [Desulfoplanes sp.]|nr:outer membrane lipoprotein carrier protein LolA [Desulfoplanes sp.]
MRRIPFIFYCLTFFCCLCVSSAVMAAQTDLRTVLTDIEKRSQKIITISSDFVQETHLSMFDDTVVSTGHFMFKAKDKLRWEYLTPIEDGFALDGTTGVRWNGTDGTRQPFTLQNDPVMHVVATQLLAWASFDQQWLTKEYDIKITASSPLTFTLTPKSAAARTVMSTITIVFSQHRDSVQRVELHENGQDFTCITFTNTVINGPVPDATFR